MNKLLMFLIIIPIFLALIPIGSSGGSKRFTLGEFLLKTDNSSNQYFYSGCSLDHGIVYLHIFHIRWASYAGAGGDMIIPISGHDYFILDQHKYYIELLDWTSITLRWD